MRRRLLPLFILTLLLGGVLLLSRSGPAASVYAQGTLPGGTTAPTSGGTTTSTTNGVVACGPGTSSPECNICGLFQTGYNIIRLGFFFIGPIVVLMIIFSGIFYITSAGFEERVKRAKTSLTGAMIGLIIIFIAYAGVKAITTALGYSSDIFSAVDCKLYDNPLTGSTPPNTPPGGGGTGTGTGGTPAAGVPAAVYVWAARQTPACTVVDPATLVALPSNMLRPNQGTKATASVLAGLKRLEVDMRARGYEPSSTETGGTWDVTEAFPPKIEHQNCTHYNGRAIDLKVYPTTQENFRALWRALNAVNFVGLLNESGYNLDGIPPKTYSTTTGANIHAES